MDRTLIFLHIPRTAGTTLHRIIEQNYTPDEMFSCGPDAHASVRAFRELSEERRAAIRVLKGHMAYGIHEAVPGQSTYLTLLRDPVERLISAYYYIKGIPSNPLYPELVRCGSLKSFVESGVSYMTDNGQTRLISGVWGEVKFGEMTSEMLVLAKQHLCENFSVVGLTERFDETLVLLRRAFGWSRIFYTRQNMVVGRPRKSQLSVGTRRLLDEVTKLDRQLYTFAQELFYEEVMRAGVGFEYRVRAFKFYNRLYNRFPTSGWVRWAVNALQRFI